MTALAIVLTAWPIGTASVCQSGYGDLTILRGLSLDIAAGQVLAVLGQIGVGKTTLLRTP